MGKMTIKERIRRAVSGRKDEDVFFTSDFKDFGSRRAVAQALKELAEENFLKRFSLGIYAKTKFNKLAQKRVVRLPLASLAAIAMERLGIKFELGKMATRYSRGEINQIPQKDIYEIGNQNFAREFILNGQRIYYEKNGILQKKRPKDDKN